MFLQGPRARPEIPQLFPAATLFVVDIVLYSLTLIRSEPPAEKVVVLTESVSRNPFEDGVITVVAVVVATVIEVIMTLLAGQRLGGQRSDNGRRRRIGNHAAQPCQKVGGQGVHQARFDEPQRV